MQSLIGTTLNRYRIVSQLGEGGMGAVYKAHDVTLERDVAIKVMHPHFARQPDFQERFLQEARSAARLDHPGIIQVYDFGQDHSYLYIVMEFIPGDNLERMLRDLQAQNKWIMLGEAVQLIRHVSTALDYAHRQGVLHRDVKPANIMIEPEPTEGLPFRPVVTDLGLAKLARGGVMTQEGISMGTPAYMSPEQAVGQPTDARSDVYSLGVLLFELATSQLPFPAKTLTDAIRYHVQTPPPHPRSLRPDIPEALEKVILQTMEKEPSNRFQSASGLAEALKGISAETVQIASGPTALLGAISLFTQWQESLIQQRGPSILEEFEHPGEVTQDRIQILEEDKTTRSILVKRSGMTIGREAGNDIVLDDDKASRQHARIDHDGANYRIFDMNSTNGTYLDNTRLVPGIPTIWLPEKALRIGDSWLRLHLADISGTTAGVAATRPAKTALDKTHLVTSPGKGRIGVYLEQYQVTTEPGGQASLQIVVINQGATVDQFKISVTGIPAPWTTIPAKPLQLVPGDQQEASITFNPPRSHQSRAGRYPVSISVTSQAAPGESAEVKVTLTISAFSQFSSELHPHQLRAGERGQVVIRNLGNSQEAFLVEFGDRENELAFTPPQSQLNVPEGQQAAVEFQAGLRSQRMMGGEQTHHFIAQVNPGKGAPQTHDGELVSKGMVPVWVPIFLVVLCLAMVGGISLVYAGFSSQTNRSTQAAYASQTQAVLAVVQTNDAGTATALALANANQATLDAATATANWLAGDDDKDGLTNAREAELNTIPTKRDTDEDGLDDGEEVNNRQTDPLKPDSDADGLKDGDEVSRGMNPTNPDSDADGIPDAQDPTPLQTSTATMDLPATQQSAAQTSAAQTAAAGQIAAAQTQAAMQTAAAQTAISFQATQAAQAATLTAAAARRLAYIYTSDGTTASAFKNLLEPGGFVVDLIPQGNILSTNFVPYKAILVGHETGSLSDWGDGGGSLANALDSTGLPLIGIGEGGYAFLGKLGLAIGWGNGAHFSGKEILVVDTGYPFWTTPNNVAIPADNILSLYDGSSGFVGIYYPSPLMGVEPLGAVPGDTNYYPLIMYGSRYLLWGFEDSPSVMSNKGRRLFVNLVEYMIP